MASRKRNEWLDVDESEEEEGYNSAEESRAQLLPEAKRRKLRDDSDAEEEDLLEAEAESEDDVAWENEDSAGNYKENADIAHLESLAASLPASIRLQASGLGKPLPVPSKLKKDKSGVVYLSRVPPFMKPTVLRSQLLRYGPVGRIFLTPESASSRTQRLRGGGTRRKLFLDGWVEFLHKRDAKFVADNLNAQTMGGKKRGRWHDEVWNIKYLSGVKWSHLVEQIQNENAEKAARLRAEINRSKQENKAFLENLEMGKMIEGIEAKKRDKGKDTEVEEHGTIADDSEQAAASNVKQRKKPRREFLQHGVTSKSTKKPEPGQDVQKVLSSMM